MLLLLFNNINIQSIWMLSLEIFESVCAAAADYGQIRYRPSIPAGASRDFINEYNHTSQFFTSSRKISCSEKSFHIFHSLYTFKKNGHFSGNVTSQAFERVLSFCWNSRCIYLWHMPHVINLLYAPKSNCSYYLLSSNLLLLISF